MNNKLEIEEFISRLHAGTITPGELTALVAALKGFVSDKALYELMSETWEKSVNFEGTISSEELLAQLHAKLDRPYVKEADIISHKTNAFSQRIKAFGRYAAMFIVALGISFAGYWLIKSKSGRVVSSITTNEVSVPYGSKSHVVLPDGSVVNLNSGSTMRYTSNFDNNRKVYIEGEAFFNVKKDAKHPFFVQTSNIVIRVLGTVFNVKSYPEENIIETTLVSGSVQIFEKKNDDTEHLQEIALLKPNQKAVFYKDKKHANEVSDVNAGTGAITVKEVPHIEVATGIKTGLYTAWKDNQLIFNSEKFESIIPKLERWYNIEIENQFKELNNSRLTGKFDKESIEQALKALQISIPFHYTIEKNKITIYK
jgi:transmembrane sensor